MRQLVKKLIPLVIAGAAVSANASPLGPLSSSSLTPTKALETFSSIVGSGTFEFSLDTMSNVNLEVFGPLIDFGLNRTFRATGVYGLFSGTTSLGATSFNSPLTFTGLAAGDYTIAWAGVKVGTLGGAVGVAGYAVPVPEPETYAMLLAGLGMMGLIARRRSRQIS